MPNTRRVSDRHSFARAITAVLLALALLIGATAPWRSGPLSVEAGGGLATTAWVEFGPGGTPIARAITAAESCPTLSVDGVPAAMQERARPAAEYPVLTCETALATGVRSAEIDGLALPLPKRNPQRIAVIGDTGCRLKGKDIQACNDPEQWPFARVAQSAAAWGPDLVIHVGDYHYREGPCPPGNAGCAGSAWGQNSASWFEDFFTPGRPLLLAAPWVVVRGNHELCSRAGEGWFRFLDPRAVPAACTDYTEPYAVPLGDAQLVVMDSANADDFKAEPAQVAIYRAQFETARRLAGRDTWLVTHKPLWATGAAEDDSAPSGETIFTTNPTLQAASDLSLPPAVQFILAGHLHIWQAFNYAGARTPQFVVGNGGTALDPPIDVPLPGRIVAGVPIAAGTRAIDRFGFMTLEPVAGGWLAVARDRDGAQMSVCTVGGQRLACGP